MKRIILLILVVLISAACSSSKYSMGDKKAFAGNEAEKQQISDGVILHDQGDFDGAIEIYQDVLKKNPDNTMALYEMAYSQFAKNDKNAALESAMKGLQYKSDQYVSFAILAANTLDIQGKNEESIKVYLAALETNTEEQLLHYNLGFAYYNGGKLEEAEKHIEESIKLNNNHPNSHYLYATLVEPRSELVAILMYGKYLALLPDGPAFKQIAEKFDGMLLSGVKKESANEVSINLGALLDPNLKAFKSVELFYKLSLAQIVAENEEVSEWELIDRSVKNIFKIVEENKLAEDYSFIETYLMKYYKAVIAEGYQDEFINLIHYGIQYPESVKWLNDNTDRVNKFIEWNKNYKM